MAGVWAVKNHTGEVLQDFTAASRFEVGLKVVPKPYDAFRLRVSASYRELFDRAVSRILDQKRWQIVRVRRKVRARQRKKRRAPCGVSKAPRSLERRAGQARRPQKPPRGRPAAGN